MGPNSLAGDAYCTVGRSSSVGAELLAWQGPTGHGARTTVDWVKVVFSRLAVWLWGLVASRCPSRAVKVERAREAYPVRHRCCCLCWLGRSVRGRGVGWSLVGQVGGIWWCTVRHGEARWTAGGNVAWRRKEGVFFMLVFTGYRIYFKRENSIYSTEKNRYKKQHTNFSLLVRSTCH